MDAKRQQRNLVIDHIQTLHKLQPNKPITMLIFDDVLEGNLFIDDLKTAIPDIKLSRVFSPNIKPSIVAMLRTKGVHLTAEMCACKFIEAFEDMIREMGGFRIIFADVYGGFDYGAGVVIKDIANRKLFSRGHRSGVKGEGLLAFASSDLFARRQWGSREDETHHVYTNVVHILWTECGIKADRISLSDDFPVQYNTMQFYAVRLQWKR